MVALIEKAAQGSPSAAVAAATVPSSQQQGSSSLPVATVAAAAAAATLSPAVDGSLAHVPSLFAGSTLRRHDDRVATIASPTSNIPTSVERQPFESPAASNLRPPPSAASCTSRELSSDVQTPRPPTPQSSHAAIAAKLVGLYKLPAVNDVAVNHLSPWFVDVSGVDGKLPVPSILTSTAASHRYVSVCLMLLVVCAAAAVIGEEATFTGRKPRGTKNSRHNSRATATDDVLMLLMLLQLLLLLL